MELKRYQQAVLDDLQAYLDHLKVAPDLNHAFTAHWEAKGVGVSALDGMQPYVPTLGNVPNVCIKVPTGGGKTFLACAALEPIFRSLGNTPSQLVVWLVPSESIFRQTLATLRNPAHPYRQKLDQLFQGRVQILNKEQLNSGASINPESMKSTLTICVLIYASLRAKNKEDRKLHQENGQLTQFETLVKQAYPDEDVSGNSVIKALRPVVVVDESHNATSDLSVDMLKNLNPRFVLDLTATPRKSSNIISFANAMQLKAENMVKLPVLVSNYQDKHDLMVSAIGLRRSLEEIAKAEEAKGAPYIRPILLLQAQPQDKKQETVETFQKVREMLIKQDIAASEIAIKTSEVDELKPWPDLMSRDCPIRYVITVNALKEGWDAPFAYVLASLANKTSTVDVEQIVGRVLRLPYARKHGHDALNTSYVLTSSANFTDTLKKVVDGLNRAGFSEQDYRVSETSVVPPPPPLFTSTPTTSAAPTSTDYADELAAEIGNISTVVAEPAPALAGNTHALLTQATTEQRKLDQEIAAATAEGGGTPTPPEVKAMQKRYSINETYKAAVSEILLPKFYIKDARFHQNAIFSAMAEQPLTKEELLVDADPALKFTLANKGYNIDFLAGDSQLFRVDLEQSKGDDSRPVTQQLSHAHAREFQNFVNALPQQQQTKVLVEKVLQALKQLDMPAHAELKSYIARLIDSLQPPQFEYVKQNHERAAYQIKQYIERLKEDHQRTTFQRLADSHKLEMKFEFAFPTTIALTSVADPLPMYGLYSNEGDMNQLERKFIQQLTQLDSVLCWHRNLGRGRGFFINGYLDHYPDFIVITRSQNVVVVETKGNHLANQEPKIHLGQIWAQLATRYGKGRVFEYFMLFDQNPIAGGRSMTQVLEAIRNL